MSRKAIPRPAVMILLGWGLLAAIFGIYDLPISRSFAEPGSLWGDFIEGYGEIPGLTVIVAALLILGSESLRAGGGAALARGTGLLTLAAVATLYGTAVLLPGMGVGPEALAGPGWLLWIPALLLVSMAGLLAWRRSPGKGLKSLSFAHGTIRLALLNFILFVQPAKVLWGRVRFRDLDPATFAEYTAWFAPQGPTGHHSFPSGHTALGWMLLPLLLLVADRPRALRITILLLILCWGALVAAARVRTGDHYASDVLFPTAMALLITFGRSDSTATEG